MSGGLIDIEYDMRLAETLTAAQGDDHKGEWIKPFYGQVSKLGGESMLDVQARMVDFWKSLEFASGQDYTICSHGDPLHLLYRYLVRDNRLLSADDEQDETYQSKGSIRPLIVRSVTDYEVQDFFRP